MNESFPLTREAALVRWREFRPRVPGYGARRNFVGTSDDGVSRLSPAIRFGLIAAEEIVRDSLAAYDLRRVEKWVQEVCWRSYWKGWLEMRPQVWTSWRRRVREQREGLPDAVLARVRDVSRGRSGVAVMDRFAHQLRETGYLHNHARMWWASFWIHAERLPWELGADFFFQHLLDADPASNTLSWRWVAGLQTAGKTYLVRRGNLERYCAPSLLADTTGLERLEDGGVCPAAVADHTDLSRHALPELPTEPSPLPGRFGIWIHTDDLGLETGPLAILRPVSVAAVTREASDALDGLSERRTRSIHTALQDGLSRAGAHFQVPGMTMDANSTAVALRTWAEQERLDVIVAMAPGVGPVADELPAIRRALPVPLRLYRRPWDAQMYPRAKSGFFSFWETTARDFEQQYPPAQLTLL
jgi:deoxyribodipyrimidine photo-lyase